MPAGLNLESLDEVAAISDRARFGLVVEDRQLPERLEGARVDGDGLRLRILDLHPADVLADSWGG